MVAGARASGQQLVVADVSDLREVEEAFTAFVKRDAGALYVGTGAFLTFNRARLAELAARYALPSSFSQREGVEAGGLMSYGTSQTDAYRQVGVYIARILNGQKPGDLPVAQASRFEFVINPSKLGACIGRASGRPRALSVARTPPWAIHGPSF